MRERHCVCEREIVCVRESVCERESVRVLGRGRGREGEKHGERERERTRERENQREREREKGEKGIPIRSISTETSSRKVLGLNFTDLSTPSFQAPIFIILRTPFHHFRPPASTCYAPFFISVRPTSVSITVSGAQRTRISGQEWAPL